jgi:hypothetical protein
LEESELFGSTKQKLDLPPGIDCDSQQPDNVKYSIPRPNTRLIKACIEEFLVFAEHEVAHSISVLETNFFIPIGILHDCQPTLPKDVGQCKPIHGLRAIPKSGLANMTHQLQRTKYSRRNIAPPTMWNMSFGFALMISNVV